YAVAGVADQCDQRNAVLEAAVRPDRRFRDGVADRARAGGARRQSRHAGQVGAGTDRLREGASGRGELRVLRQRQRPASVRRDVRRNGRHPDDARALSRQLASVTGLIQAGKLRALAVTGATRSPQMPDLPTLAESGFPSYAAYVWMGLLAPKGTPTAVIDTLYRGVSAALAEPQVKEYMTRAS